MTGVEGQRFKSHSHPESTWLGWVRLSPSPLKPEEKPLSYTIQITTMANDPEQKPLSFAATITLQVFLDVYIQGYVPDKF